MPREVTGCVQDVNLQESMGPAGVAAINSRCVASRLSSLAALSDDIRVISAPGVLRCCNCGLPVTEDLKLLVRDPHDPIAPPAKPGCRVWARDWVRVPLNLDELPTNGAPSAEYSDYVACTPPCALRFMYDSPDFMQSHVPHIFALMLWRRHRIDEPTNAAPSPEALAYLYRTKPLKITQLPPLAKGPAPMEVEVTKRAQTAPMAVEANRQAQPVPMAVDESHLVTTTAGPSRGLVGREIGLPARSFYWLLATSNLIGYVQSAPMHIPPMEDEQAALSEKDYRFTQYYYFDSSAGPPQTGAKMPAHLPASGIKLDANTDVDNETDFALDSIHPPFHPPKLAQE